MVVFLVKVFFAILCAYCLLFLSTVNGSLIESSLSQDAENCHSTFTQAINYFATKTPYINKTLNSFTPEGCTAQSIWILNRHGTRLPSDVGKMLKILPRLRDDIVNASLHNRGKLCENEISRLKSWTPDPSLEVSRASFLSEQGRKELFGIGQRFQQRFPHLFPPAFSNETYYFRSSVEQRAIESGKSFAEAIFGPNVSEVYFPTPIEGDPILHFYKTCRKWIEQVDKNPEAKIESDRFKQSSFFQNVVANLKSRLGIPDGGLAISDVKLIYSACRYETAWNPETLSEWCAVFTEEDFRVLEYSEDLEDFYMDGYPYEITYEQACTPLKDLLSIFSARIKNIATGESSENSSRLVTAYFGHSGTLLKFYARMGLYREDHNLTSASFEQESERKWRSTKMGTFASNIAFILFSCPKDADEPFQIGTLVSEEKVAVPACNGNWICGYDKFLKEFQHIADTCDLERICKV